MSITSGLSILIRDVISLLGATSYDFRYKSNSDLLLLFLMIFTSYESSHGNHFTIFYKITFSFIFFVKI